MQDEKLGDKIPEDHRISNEDDPGMIILTRKVTGQLDENPDDMKELEEEYWSGAVRKAGRVSKDYNCGWGEPGGWRHLYADRLREQH